MFSPTNQGTVKDLAQTSGVGADISFDAIVAKVSFDLLNTLEENRCKKTPQNCFRHSTTVPLS